MITAADLVVLALCAAYVATAATAIVYAARLLLGI
jgi:hypothetical protein